MALILDLETTIKGTIGSNKASPFVPENFVVLGGMLENGVAHISPGAGAILERLKTYSGCLVGANFKFDIHWLRREGFDFHAFVSRGGTIWDCSIAEYILTAQESKFASLDDMAAKYGGTLKDSRIKEMWEAGVQTEDIDSDMLGDYLDGDLWNTEIVYKAQLKEIEKQGNMALVLAIMDAAMAIEEMEYNGLPIDLKILDEMREKMGAKRAEVESKLRGMLCRQFPDVPVDVWNLNSKDQLSAVLFGGTLKWTEKVPDGEFKSGAKKGLPKFKNTDRQKPVVGKYIPNKDWALKKPGLYSTDENTLKELVSQGSGFASLLLEYRAADKEYSTYAEGLPKLIYPDCKIHANLHQTATNTGRLSSSEPNLQNQPTGSEIKKVFRSRWPDGRLVSLDFKQLEVIALAYITKDAQLIDDILNGRDLHNETGKIVFPGRDMSKEERRIVKTVNFGLAYGGGADTLAQQAGISPAMASAIIAAFYERYPGVKEWHKHIVQEVAERAQYKGDRTVAGRPCQRAYLPSVTGRRYLFVEMDRPEWLKYGEDTNFTPTKPKNYPVQGLATGDIVPLVLGRIFKELCTYPDIKMVNTIHDSIVFDCKTEEVAKWASLRLKRWAEMAPQYFEETFGVPFGLPLTVTTAMGKDWYDVDKED